MTTTPATEPQDACSTLDTLAHEHSDRAVSQARVPARVARCATPALALSATTKARLHARGVDALYTHQAAAIDALRDRRSVAVVSGTASGKSLCYQVPIVESVLAATGDTALVVYPTKALAQDQLRSFREWLVPSLVAATYDGDTAPDDRTSAARTPTCCSPIPRCCTRASSRRTAGGPTS